MILALIGMSGAGKSMWASRLAAAGYEWLHCDELIAERLRASFDVGAGSVYDLGQWMGLPYERRYAEREALYLANEAAVLATIAGALAGPAALARELVVDLTGSAIYIDGAVLARLRQSATIVYLAVAPELHGQMVREYLANPRPVIWNGLYQPLPGEPPADALARCYPRMLVARERLYQRLADVTLPAERHRDPAFTVEDLLRCAAAAQRTFRTPHPLAPLPQGERGK